MTKHDLELVIENLETGRWGYPINKFSISELFSGDKLSYWIKTFSEYEKLLFSREQTVYSLKTVMQHLDQKSDSKNNVELVWTGPEAQNSTLRDTSVVAQDLFREAQSEVIIAGFAFYQGKDLFKELAKKYDDNPVFRVTFFVDIRREGNTSIENEILLKFKIDFKKKQWPGNRMPDIYYDPRTLSMEIGMKSSMHAKCIVADSKKALITSANFTNAAHHRNIEAGAVFESVSLSKSLNSQFFNLVELGLLKKL